MKARLTLVGLLVLTISGIGSADEPTYVGASKCKICHKVEYASWETLPHAKAFDRLKPEEQSKAECLTCHATGNNAELPGVQCEACHGPGSLYKSPKVMSKSKYKEDPDGMHKMSLEAGMIVPDEKTCLGCHNDKSPTFKGFNYEEAKAKIKHWE